MLISALMVTRPQSRAMLLQAFADFARQQWSSLELVVVHDGDDAFGAELHNLGERHRVTTRVFPVGAGTSLGDARNVAVEHAQGALIAQWDDDDRHHPDRLRLQAEALLRENADCAFLCDQLHWFRERGLLYWEDWRREAYPLDIVQGTLLARRERMLRYPAQARGEDTVLTLALLAGQRRFARLRGAGWSYVYTFHGGNAWSEAHHAAIAAAKGLSPARLLGRVASLRARLAEYDPPLPPVMLPYRGGALALDTSSATSVV